MAVLSGTPSISSDSSDPVVPPEISELEFDDSLGSQIEWKKTYKNQNQKFSKKNPLVPSDRS